MLNHIEFEIENKKFRFVYGYHENKELRQSLNELTRETYGYDFENWFLQGLWSENYQPFSLLHENKIVSNISVSPIQFNFSGSHKIGLQISSVITHKEFRKLGLSRILFNIAAERFHFHSNFMYLFANESLQEYYERLGFKIVKEYQHKFIIQETLDTKKVRKIDIEDEMDKELLRRFIKTRYPIAKLSMIGNDELIEYYCHSYLKNNVYYLEDMHLIAIAINKKDCLYINDIFTTRPFDMKRVAQALSDCDEKEIVFGFTPSQSAQYKCYEIKDRKSLLFMKGESIPKHCMFPLLSHF